MKKWLLAGVTLLAITAGSAQAQDIVYKPIDTNKFVVQPTRTAANIAAQTIDLVGNTAANSIDNNGYIKTFNNVFSQKISIPLFQPGSNLPAVHRFPSTRYKNYNTPVMPQYQPVRRR